MSAVAARIELFAENPRAKERIDTLREEARFLVDEIIAREKQLHPGAYKPICPGCQRLMQDAGG